MGVRIVPEVTRVIAPGKVIIEISMDQAGYLAELCYSVLSSGVVGACGLAGMLNSDVAAHRVGREKFQALPYAEGNRATIVLVK